MSKTLLGFDVSSKRTALQRGPLLVYKRNWIMRAQACNRS